MFRTHRLEIVRLSAIVVPVVVAAVLVPFRGSFAATASALLLVAVVVAVATSGDRPSGYLATVSATLSFDVLLTQPYGRLEITHRSDLETAVCLFVVGIAVTEICVRSRRHRESALEETSYVAVLHSVAELVASGAPQHEVIAVVRQLLIDLLDRAFLAGLEIAVDITFVGAAHDSAGRYTFLAHTMTIDQRL